VIRCATAQDLIDAFVTGTLPDSDAAVLADHVRGCPSCAARLGSMTRLAELLGSLPTVEPAPGFEERQLAAVLADRQRRHEHRSWLAQLRVQVLRGTLRTTGTLVATVAVVAVLAAGFALAASTFVPGIRLNVLPGASAPHPSAPVTAVAPPTPTAAPSVTPRVEATPTATPAPTPAPTRPAATPAPSAVPSPSPSPEPTAPVVIVVSPTAPPAASTAPSPTPEPSAKCRRTPFGLICYSPAPTSLTTEPTSEAGQPAPSEAPTPSP
jgi:anti-sigma factor RsiW